MKDQSCGTCVFFQVGAIYLDKGRCRRYPPQFVMGMTKRNNLETGQKEDVPISTPVFPALLTTDIGCGEYRDKS